MGLKFEDTSADGLAPCDNREMEAAPALLCARIWIFTAVMVSLYAERRISSLAERANLLAKHANDRMALSWLNSLDHAPVVGQRGFPESSHLCRQ